MLSRRDLIIDVLKQDTNPMFSIHEVCRRLHLNGDSSGTNDYRAVYKELEKLTVDKITYCHTTTNSGNIYMLAERAVNPSAKQSDGDISF